MVATVARRGRCVPGARGETSAACGSARRVVVVIVDVLVVRVILFYLFDFLVVLGYAWWWLVWDEVKVDLGEDVRGGRDTNAKDFWD